MRGRLRIGCAMWAHPAWRARYGVGRGNELAWYGSSLSTVEGNTTFYALPTAETVGRWADQAPPDLRFCFKLPRHVTHERRLRGVDGLVDEFLDRMHPLADRMGPVQVQLPPSFGPSDLPVLLTFLDGVLGREGREPTTWPADRPLAWAVEVRHPDFAPGGSTERRLNDALAERGVDRVVLDSRALFAGVPITREEQEAQRAKPQLPVRPVATGPQPIVRLIGRSDTKASIESWRPWFPKVVEWVDAGLEPHLFVHTPDNVAAPEVAHLVWREIASLTDPPWPPPEPLTITPDDRQLGLWA